MRVRRAGKLIDGLTMTVQNTNTEARLPASTDTFEAEVCRTVMVVGSGRTALHAAQLLAAAGHAVELVRGPGRTSGDTLDRISAALASLAVDALEPAADWPAQACADAGRITVREGASVTGCRGQLGDFRIAVACGGATEVVRAGAIVVTLTDLAPAGMRGQARDGGCTAATDILSFLDEDSSQVAALRRVAFVLDGTAEQGRLSSTIVWAKARQLLTAGTDCVRVYCHHARVAGPHLDALYRSARTAGVEFLRYDGDVEVTGSNGVARLRAVDAQLGGVMHDEFDRVVFGDLALPSGAAELLQTLGVAGADLTAADLGNIWFAPCETRRPGVLLIGASGSDSMFGDVRVEAALAAARVRELLSSDTVTVLDDAAVVDAEKCVACLTCVRICPHRAIDFDREQEAASVSKLACQRCGTCAAECPAEAIQLPGHDDERTAAAIAECARLVVFACTNSACLAAADVAGTDDGAPQIVEVPCAGKVDPRHVLHALEHGAERVLVLGCSPGSCKYFDGSTRAGKRVARLRNMLEHAGLDQEKVRWGSLIASEVERYREMVGTGV